MSLPAHLRRFGPGTAGRNKDRDAAIAARSREGATNVQIGREFHLSGERVRQILFKAASRH